MCIYIYIQIDHIHLVIFHGDQYEYHHYSITIYHYITMNGDISIYEMGYINITIVVYHIFPFDGMIL